MTQAHCNLYQVVSEELEDDSGKHCDLPEPPEPYAIVEWVVAQSAAQARWLAWKGDRSYTGDVRDMPRMRTKVLRRNIPETDPRTVSNGYPLEAP